MASEQRQRDDSQIRRATTGLVIGSLAATGVFGGLAAASADDATPAVQTQSSNDSAASPGQSFDDSPAPAQSSSPPVAQSGGS
jgi:hypothetical protein